MSISPHWKEVEEMLIHHFETETHVPKKSYFLKETFLWGGSGVTSNYSQRPGLSQCITLKNFFTSGEILDVSTWHMACVDVETSPYMQNLCNLCHYLPQFTRFHGEKIWAQSAFEEKKLQISGLQCKGACTLRATNKCIHSPHCLKK